MCGIFALIPGPTNDWRGILNRAIIATGTRGRDAYGLAMIYDHTVKVNRTIGTAEEFLETNASYLRNSRKPKIILGVARAQPLQEVLPTKEESNPPIIHDRFVMVHNGIVSNDKQLVEKYKLDWPTGNDSEVLLRVLTQATPEGNFDPEMIEEIEGSAAFLCFNAESQILHYYRDFKPLVVGRDATGNTLFISTEQMLKSSFGLGEDTIWFDSSYHELPMNSYGEVLLISGQLSCLFPAEGYHTKRTHHMTKMDKKKCLAVCSGGLDSVTTAAYMIDKGYDVTFLFFDYGQRAAKAEWRAVENTAWYYTKPAVKIDLKWLGQLGGSPLTDYDIDVPQGIYSCETNECWVPARNLVMLSLAAAYADRRGYHKIVYGANLQENSSPYPDNEVTFAERMDAAVRMGCLQDVRVEAPLANMMKEDIIRMGLTLGVPYALTHSCDRGYEKDKGGFLLCGDCGCCYSSALAFTKAGIADPRRANYHHLGKDIINDLRRYGKLDWYVEGYTVSKDWRLKKNG